MLLLANRSDGEKFAMKSAIIYCNECHANKLSKDVCSACGKRLCRKHVYFWPCKTGETEEIKLCRSCMIKRFLE